MVGTSRKGGNTHTLCTVCLKVGPGGAHVPQGVVCTAPPRASGPAPQARAADGSAAVCRAMQVPMSTQLRTTLGRSRPVAPGLCEPRLEFVQVSEAGTLLVPCARHPRPNLRHTLAAPHSRVACCVLLLCKDRFQPFAYTTIPCASRAHRVHTMAMAMGRACTYRSAARTPDSLPSARGSGRLSAYGRSAPSAC